MSPVKSPFADDPDDSNVLVLDADTESLDSGSSADPENRIVLPQFRRKLFADRGERADILTSTRLESAERLMPPVSDDEVRAAVKNNLFDSVRLVKTLDADDIGGFPDFVKETRQALFQKMFRQLSDNGINPDMSDAEITPIIEGILRRNQNTRRGGPERKVDPLKGHYDNLILDMRAFDSIFDQVEFILKCGEFTDQHATAFVTIIDAIGNMPSEKPRSQLLRILGSRCQHLTDRYIFELPTVLDSSHMTELLLAMPVWFTALHTNKKDTWVNTEYSHTSKHDLCSRVSTPAFSWLYQLYNVQNRRIVDFPSSPDPIPTEYRAFRGRLEGLAATEVITSPYHQMGPQAWITPAFRPSIDPIAFCTISGCPKIVVLKRWSGTGVFPLMAQLVARTAEHLKVMREAISRITNVSSNIESGWLDSGWVPQAPNASVPASRTSVVSRLPAFINILLDHYKKGTALAFLRGQTQPVGV